MFAVGVMRFARDRPNTDVLLGNHEVAMLWALHDPTRIGFWISIGGQPHDLEELRKDEALQHWMRTRPALLKLRDQTLVQHCGNDAYLNLVQPVESDVVHAVNRRTKDLLADEGERLLWDLLSGPNVFESHRAQKPAIYHGGKAINFDGGLSRTHRLHQRGAPLAASVGPLD